MTKYFRNILHIILSLCLITFLASLCNAKQTKNGGGFKGVFIFGTSISKGNYPPYLIDFHDISLTSCGYGTLHQTHLPLGKMMELNEQIRHFEEVMLPAFENKLKSYRTAILSEYSFFIALTNDHKFISTYHSQIQKLYSLGARNFVLQYPVIQREGNLFLSNQLKSMVNHLKHELCGSNILVFDSAKTIKDIIYDSYTSGINNRRELLRKFSCKDRYRNPGSRKRNGNNLKGIFVMGSSVVDYGNNNLVPGGDSNKANYLPYGLDYRFGPTGRFSNGNNLADQITALLKLPTVPSFLDHQINNTSILYGVNLASGGSGILNQTGVTLGATSTYQQIQNLKNTIVPKLESYFGGKSKNIISEYLFMVAAGNNDHTLRYLTDPDEDWTPYTAELISAYITHLKTLYDLGARKMLLVSVYPVGCNPILLQFLNRTTCVDELNSAVMSFHEQLLNVVKRKAELGMPLAKFSVLNSANILLDVINNPQPTGISNVRGMCCELAPGSGSCARNGRLCENRQEYLFMDGVHLTSAGSAVLANKAYHSKDLIHAYPINLRELSHLT